jgi:hypothetical protein
VPIGMAGLPVAFLPILAFAGRLAWRIWKAGQGAPVTAPLPAPAQA